MKLRHLRRIENQNTTQIGRKNLRVQAKEEANLRGISIKVEKSDIYRFICWSRDDPSFFVLAWTNDGQEVGAV